MNQAVKFPLIDILPFLDPVLGGAVIAIALYPFFGMAKRWVGNRNMLAGVLLALLIPVIRIRGPGERLALITRPRKEPS